MKSLPPAPAEGMGPWCNDDYSTWWVVAPTAVAALAAIEAVEPPVLDPSYPATSLNIGVTIRRVWIAWEEPGCDVEVVERTVPPQAVGHMLVQGPATLAWRVDIGQNGPPDVEARQAEPDELATRGMDRS